MAMATPKAKVTVAKSSASEHAFQRAFQFCKSLFQQREQVAPGAAD
jgi:hypothetical protein